jgi:RHS repeat-associated protein
MKYYPYGAQRSSTGDMITDKLFTGQQREDQAPSSLGLYNYGARFYSTVTGRFVSPDPIVPDPSEPIKKLEGALTVSVPPGFSDMAPLTPPASGPEETLVPNPGFLNRYAYTLNNPLRYTDPNGLCLTSDMECTPEIAFVLITCAGGSAADCAGALRLLGREDFLYVALVLGLSGFMDWVRESAQGNSYFLEAALPANDPILAFTQALVNLDLDATIVQMFFSAFPGFVSGLAFLFPDDSGGGFLDRLGDLGEWLGEKAGEAGGRIKACAGEMAVGAVMVGGGVAVTATGGVFIATGVAEATATGQTIVGVYVGAHTAIVGAEMAVVGFGFVAGGVGVVSTCF